MEEQIMMTMNLKNALLTMGRTMSALHPEGGEVTVGLAFEGHVLFDATDMGVFPHPRPEPSERRWYDQSAQAKYCSKTDTLIGNVFVDPIFVYQGESGCRINQFLVTVRPLSIRVWRGQWTLKHCRWLGEWKLAQGKPDEMEGDWQPEDSPSLKAKLYRDPKWGPAGLLLRFENGTIWALDA